MQLLVKTPQHQFDSPVNVRIGECREAARDRRTHSWKAEPDVHGRRSATAEKRPAAASPTPSPECRAPAELRPDVRLPRGQVIGHCRHWSGLGFTSATWWIAGGGGVESDGAASVRPPPRRCPGCEPPMGQFVSTDMLSGSTWIPVSEIDKLDGFNVYVLEEHHKLSRL